MSSCAPTGQKRRLFKDAGRACPLDYRISPTAFAGTPELSCEVLYVVGGLYGNPFAAAAIDALVASEADRDTQVVLNGDIHWFDKTAANFADIERRIERYVPLVGNVEAELRRQEDVGVGCGCAYPDCTPDDAVARSNRIHKMLSFALEANPELKGLLDRRPSTLLASVCGRRVAITHGDEKLLGGWDNSRESLQDILRQDEVDTFMAACDLDVFTTTHTCAPAAIKLARGVVINNGAAGLPNFAGENFGLCVRIACCPREDALFGCELDGLFVQAVPVRYDHDAYLAWFDELWDSSSPAALSYRDRIAAGPVDEIKSSLLGGFKLGATGRAELRERQRAQQQREGGEGGIPRATETDVRVALERVLYFEDMIDDDRARVTENEIHTLQANITARCNLACTHCHVRSTPARTEAMSHEVLDAILKVLKDRKIQTLDVTGGAPEMHPEFEWFLREAAAIAPNIMVRSNLVVLQEAPYERFIDLYDELEVELVASLPNVFEAESDAQRGRKTFDATLEMLRKLNERGYGIDKRHVLDVVFNPQEPVLPPEQERLEDLYRRRLGNLDIAFDRLFAVTNNPIGRYGASLLDDGLFEDYMNLLLDAFNPDTCPDLMCRHQMTIGWDGTVYDCDFNHVMRLGACASALPDGDLTRAQVDYALLSDEGRARSIFDYARDATLPLRRAIVFGNHCYACAAGLGSSCGGTLVQA